MSFDKCMLCERPLKSKRSMERGIGNVCARRLGLHLVSEKAVRQSLFGGLSPVKKAGPITRFFSLNHLTKVSRNEKSRGESLCVVNGEFYTATEAKALKCAVGF